MNEKKLIGSRAIEVAKRTRNKFERPDIPTPEWLCVEIGEHESGITVSDLLSKYPPIHAQAVLYYIIGLMKTGMIEPLDYDLLEKQRYEETIRLTEKGMRAKKRGIK